uniref:NADP-dependent glyceraldehyde-3-phosphate dehydrogenase n=1 Tax=Aureoumbra lagunensis TaxID=44058 RepID=A0A7S3JW93_9STRA|eukprot:CAMPEP_0197311414 /NCGR_PEP_ID=MMETSP0891-20130614/9876_1 /TAXON_ID=44058 ORGANISM="Aureoumbra lagunensis, Strain CCMP1510" /NCGR_SAMPLE_ID=MMETSP0891 /ASSEMBLY_ACC=CAM_ASM_000534 /LENGTH=538 /DNA_ID=CAMNT_0042797503 /DNA_START=24 /DNA_END=1640 /DNA_ORIENTATION=-
MSTGFVEDETLQASVSIDDEFYKKRPFVDGSFTFINGVKKPYTKVTCVTSPIRGPDGERIQIGTEAHMTCEEATVAVDAAHKAFAGGLGVWPSMSLRDRIITVEKYLDEVLKVRDEIISVLQWEICKNTNDATNEFDRTIKFVRDVIELIRSKGPTSIMQPSFEEWTTISGVTGKVRRGPYGIILCVAPFNYPLNEMYAMLIPALIMGNTIVLKIPSIGGLAHLLTADAFALAFPPGVINFISGSGRETMPCIMRTGKIDMLGFIGGKKGCDSLIRDHLEPHRLKVFSQLEGNNMAIILPSANLDVAVQQIISGTTSYNGQRCTAIKIVAVHTQIADDFVQKYKQALEKLKIGLPFDAANSITPLPDENKPNYLAALIHDAKAKGATIVSGGTKHFTLIKPTALYPVPFEARLFSEEQFGPLIPISKFDSIHPILSILANSWNGQQLAIFCSGQDKDALTLLDKTQSIFGRININSAPSRGPDQFPFSARRSSAMGTMSVSHAIEAFSLEVIVAYKDNPENKVVADYLDSNSAFFTDP